jgi:hypothetical protein
MLRRRRTDTFGLSFLDCICCGFGAVILFYVMMSAQGGIRRIHRTDDLKSEVNRLAERVDAGTRNLVVLRNVLEKTQSDTATEEASAVRLLAEIKQQSEQLSSYDATSVARREHVEQLQSDMKALEEGKRRLEAGSEDRAPPGQDTRMVPSGGERRYITGITLRGKRILILVDRSASMLHEDLVSIIRLRNSGDDAKRAASKWRRTIQIVDWLATQMPAATKYQIYAFNTKADPLVANTAGTWLESANGDALARNIAALQLLVPRDGTSLVNAFAAARTLNPRPDQIILITDGLPTQGKSAGQRKYIDAGARARLFDDAVAVLPENVPVDVVLLPMKGDVQAAHRFWRLARLTNGTLLAPSRDWP